MSKPVTNDYVLGHSNQELDRLISQGHYFGELTAEVLRAADIVPGMRVLDVGCGAGDVSFLLASLVGASGEVTGIDRSPDAVNMARQRVASAGLTNVRFMAGDVQNLQMEDRFDAIVGRLVLMYFPDPAAELRRLVKLLTPGGLVVFHEFDVTAASSEPPLPLFNQAIARIAETLRRAGANPRMGLKLPQAFRDAGLPPPQFLARTRISLSTDTRSFEQIAAVTRTLVPAMEKFGVASAAEVSVDTLANRLAEESIASDATGVAPLFVGAWSRI